MNTAHSYIFQCFLSIHTVCASRPFDAIHLRDTKELQQQYNRHIHLPVLHYLCIPFVHSVFQLTLLPWHVRVYQSMNYLFCSVGILLFCLRSYVSFCISGASLPGSRTVIHGNFYLSEKCLCMAHVLHSCRQSIKIQHLIYRLNMEGEINFSKNDFISPYLICLPIGGF